MIDLRIVKLIPQGRLYVSSQAIGLWPMEVPLVFLPYKGCCELSSCVDKPCLLSCAGTLGRCSSLPGEEAATDGWQGGYPSPTGNDATQLVSHEGTHWLQTVNSSLQKGFKALQSMLVRGGGEEVGESPESHIVPSAQPSCFILHEEPGFPRSGICDAPSCHTQCPHFCTSFPTPCLCL